MNSKEVDQNIRQAIEKIAKKAKKHNNEGSIPSVQSEMDLVCQIFRELCPIRGHTIMTDWTIYDNKDKAITRPDISISKTKNLTYNKTRNKNYGEVSDKKRYAAILEIKTNFFQGKKIVKRSIGYDFYALKKINKKIKVDYLYQVTFDYRGQLTRMEIEKFKQKDNDINFIYVNLKENQ